jgi:hypothetical protein
MSETTGRAAERRSATVFVSRKVTRREMQQRPRRRPA